MAEDWERVPNILMKVGIALIVFGVVQLIVGGVVDQVKEDQRIQEEWEKRFNRPGAVDVRGEKITQMLLVKDSELEVQFEDGSTDTLYLPWRTSASEDDVTAAPDTESEVDDPNRAPDFKVISRADTPVTLSSLRGKPVVVNFWASWCGPCKSEMPAFEAAYEQYGADVHFLMINLTDGQNETAELAAAYIDKMGYSFPVYFDTDCANPLSEFSPTVIYGISSIPATFFIDADGKLVTYATGAIDGELIAKGIGMILATEPTE